MDEHKEGLEWPHAVTKFCFSFNLLRQTKLQLID